MATSTHFEFDGHRLAYDEYGSGKRVVLLLPGLLFSRRMHRPLAHALADRGYRVLCLDPLGHGDSDRPAEMWNYSMAIFGRQALGLLDHVGVDQCRTLAGPGVFHGLAQYLEGGEGVTAVDLLNEEAGEAGQQRADGPHGASRSSSQSA